MEFSKRFFEEEKSASFLTQTQQLSLSRNTNTNTNAFLTDQYQNKAPQGTRGDSDSDQFQGRSQLSPTRGPTRTGTGTGNLNLNQPDDARNVESHRQDMLFVWEPPLSCRHRRRPQYDRDLNLNVDTGNVLGAGSDPTRLYFPLELGSGQYLMAVFDVIVDAIAAAESELPSSDNNANFKLTASTSSSTTEPDVVIVIMSVFEAAMASLATFDVARAERLRLVAKKLVNAVNPSASHTYVVVESAQFLMDLGRQYLTVPGRSRDNGRIDAAALCKAAESATVIIRAVVRWPTESAAAFHVLNSIASNACRELSAIQAQLQAHAAFKERRMRAFGWQWGSVDTTGQGLAAQEGEQATRDRALELQREADALLSPRSWHALLLHRRLLDVTAELYAMMHAAADAQDLIESRRLRDLAVSVERSVDERSRLLLDTVCTLLDRAVFTSEELTKAKIAAVARHDFEGAHDIQKQLADLDHASRLLMEAAGRPYDASDRPQFLLRDQGARDDSRSVDADFVFSFAPPDELSIAALIVKAGAHSTLRAVERWPGFAALRKQRELQEASLSTPGPHSTNNTANFGYSSPNISSAMLPTASSTRASVYGRYSTFSPNVSSSASATNSHRHRDVPGSPTGGYANASAYSSPNHQNTKSVLFSPTQTPTAASAMFSSQSNDSGRAATNPQSCARASNRSSGGTGAAGVSAASLLGEATTLSTALDVLGGESSAAHTQLVQRLVGLVGDLQALATISARAGATTEAQRLSGLLAAVQQTLDADAIDEIEVPCGRGASRIDRVDGLIDSARRLSQDLRQRLQMSQKDFTFAAAASKALKMLQAGVDRVARTRRPFSLFDKVDGVEDFESRVASVGTTFVTSDFIVAVACGPEQHSIASLAIMAAASCALLDIRRSWPGITVFGDCFDPSYTQSQTQLLARSHAGYHEYASLPNNGMGEVFQSSDARFDSQLTVTADGERAIDFASAAALRALGFAPEVLRLSGFRDIDIVSAGYSPQRLRSAGLTSIDLRSSVSGVTSTAVCSSGAERDLQRTALLELFNSTQGGHWTSADGWATSQVAVEAYGLKFDGGLATRLILCRNNLRGPLPASMGSLATLTQLVLNGNALSGSIPDSISLLTNLTSLLLHDNSLQGPIPGSLKLLQSLVILRLDGNKFTGGVPQTLGEMGKLKRLSLSDNLLEGRLPSRLGGMAGLQELMLNGNRFIGLLPDTMGSLTSLTTLHLHSNFFSGLIPQSFAGLTNLTSLNLQNNPHLSVDRIQMQRVLPRCRIQS